MLCTTQVGVAQHRSMVHNGVLYSLGGAQRMSDKPTWTDGQTDWTDYGSCLHAGMQR